MVIIFFSVHRYVVWSCPHSTCRSQPTSVWKVVLYPSDLSTKHLANKKRLERKGKSYRLIAFLEGKISCREKLDRINLAGNTRVRLDLDLWRKGKMRKSNFPVKYQKLSSLNWSINIIQLNNLPMRWTVSGL